MTQLDFIPIWVLKSMMTLIGILMIWVAIRVAFSLLRRVEQRHARVIQHTTIIKNTIRVIIVALGTLIILDSLGISITPIIASLGIGGLAVGLALQDTLANYFSGFYLLIEQPIRIGDFIQLETGEEGYVEAIGWRSTKIRMLANKTVIMPNKVISSGRITNYDYLSSEVAVLIGVGVHYDSDLEMVERVTVETARDVQQTVPGAVKNFEPFIRYHTFADSSINFTVILRAERFVDNYLIKHEFIKRLHNRYNKEGIVIPFPIRTVYMANEVKDQNC